jgi:hypothetical protein
LRAELDVYFKPDYRLVGGEHVFSNNGCRHELIVATAPSRSVALLRKAWESRGKYSLP